jgi:hypothetical protein
MSKNELLLRERLDATSGPTSKGENAPNARMLRDEELDAVSGGFKYELEECMISG